MLQCPRSGFVLGFSHLVRVGKHQEAPQPEPTLTSFTQMTKGDRAAWKCRMGTFGLGLSYKDGARHESLGRHTEGTPCNLS